MPVKRAAQRGAGARVTTHAVYPIEQPILSRNIKKKKKKEQSGYYYYLALSRCNNTTYLHHYSVVKNPMVT